MRKPVDLTLDRLSGAGLLHVKANSSCFRMQQHPALPWLQESKAATLRRCRIALLCITTCRGVKKCIAAHHGLCTTAMLSGHMLNTAMLHPRLPCTTIARALSCHVAESLLKDCHVMLGCSLEVCRAGMLCSGMLNGQAQLCMLQRCPNLYC